MPAMQGRDEEGPLEGKPSRGVASYSSILPSMPSGDGDTNNDVLIPVTLRGSRHPHYPVLGEQAYEETPGSAPPHGSSAGHLLPSSFRQGHPAYSNPTTGMGSYSTLPLFDASSGTGMPSSGSIVPSSSPLGHSAYSPLTITSAAYSTLPPFDASSTTSMPSAGRILPSSSPVGHSAYSPPPTTGLGTYATLPPFSRFDASSATMPGGPSYPGYASYQSVAYNYGSGGQGYSYDANSSMPLGSYSGMVGYQPGYASPQAPTGVGYAGMGSYSAYGAQGYSYLDGGEYHQQYKGQSAHHEAYGAPRRGRGHNLGPPRSFAKNPGRPIINSDNSEHPGGVTLFVFYIPNDMTNHDLHELFKVHGTILSVSIKTEDDTGRGKGFGFVSFESAESAASAIQHLNGYQIHGKRLKVDYKKPKREEKSYQNYQHFKSHAGLPPNQDLNTPYQPRPLNYHSPPDSDFVPIQEHAAREYSEVKLSTQGSFPMQEVLLPQSREHDVHKPVLPPFDQLSGASDVDSYESGERTTAKSPAPFADLTDIGRALPDGEN